MTKTPWTPGPWTFYKRQDYEPAYGVKAPAPYHWVIPPLNLDPADCQLIALAPEMADSLADAEAAIGENLVWITDCADLLVRQKDPEALRRLKQLNDAWLSLVKITNRLPKGE